MKLPVIYMAAGNGRRFASRARELGEGQENKLLFSYRGKPLYRHVLERLAQLKSLGEDIEIYLVSQYPGLLEESRELPVIPVYSPESPRGASYSVRAGLAAAGFSPEREILRSSEPGCAFFAADQPELSLATIRRFFASIRENPGGLIAVGWGEEMGNPCYFGARYLPELFALTGDRGGKAVLRRHREECKILQAQGEWELKDVDVPPKEKP